MSDCLFCKIVAGDVPAQKIHEDDDVVAFKDIRPQAPVHFLVVPRRHVASLDAAAEGDGALLGRALLAIRKLARELDVADGYRVVTNCGARAGQSVFHLHFHVLGGRALDWPPG
jgi:histidine triad (HIT) family protein